MPDLIGHLHFYPRKSHNCLAARHSPSLCLGKKKSESLSRFAQVEIRRSLCGYLLKFLILVDIGPEKFFFRVCHSTPLEFNYPLYSEWNKQILVVQHILYMYFAPNKI